jgi:hypothetical protein
MPQLGLQHTKPVLHWALPQTSLVGEVLNSGQARWSQLAPGAAQMPQLLLQQTWPTLQVLGPHITLVERFGTSQRCCKQLPPGKVQMPQLSLQQT